MSLDLADIAPAVLKFREDRTGATAVEYGLIASLIAVAIIVGVSNYGQKLGNMFNYLGNCLTDTTTCTSG